MLAAVVTDTGADEVPLEKPFSEFTGPEKVVLAIGVSSFARVACQSVHRPLGRSDKLGVVPDWEYFST
jgi:hypothetical protein